MNNRMKKSKSILALMLITVMVLTAMIPVQAFAASVELTDVSGNWAEKEITAWVDQGFIKGYPDGTFKPNNNITRAEFITLVNRLFNFTETAPVTFKDVKATDWFRSDVAKAEKAGYLSELKDGSFIFRENIKRQEVAAIIYKLKNLTEDAEEADEYSDADKIEESFKGFIGAVKKAGYMQGYPDGSFDPEKNLTRAEAVVSLNRLLRVEIEEIGEQTVNVGSNKYITVKTNPAEAELSVKSSDETIVTAAITGIYVDLKGIKEGSATITVTASKDKYPDGEAIFKVTVVKATSSSSSGGGGYNPPANKAPVITVEGIENNTITLTQGDVFTPPVVKASDPEDGDITGSIVKTGEDNVDTSKVGEYILTYNVKDSKGRAAKEVKITVKVVAAELIASGNIKVITIGVQDVARITLASASTGTSFRSVDTNETAKIGEYLQIVATGKSKADFELLDAAGIVVGKFTVDLKTGDFLVAVTAVEAPAKSVTGEVKLTTIGLQDVARIIVSAASEGKSFRSVATNETADIGGYLQIVATGKTETAFELLDEAGIVVGTFTVDLIAGSFQIEIVPVPVQAKKVDGEVKITSIGNFEIARIIVSSATAGKSFKSLDTSEAADIGGYLQIVATGKTKAVFELLDASGSVLGSFEVALTAGTFTADVN